MKLINTILLIAMLLQASYIYSQVETEEEEIDMKENVQTDLVKYMVIRSAPTFTLQISGNFNQSILDLSGTYNDDFHSDDFLNGTDLGADKGYGVSILSKISISPRSHWRANISLNYNKVKSFTLDTDKKSEKGHSSFNIFSTGLGLEYNFTPSHKFKIYMAGEMLISMINGKVSVDTVPSDNTLLLTNFTIKNSFRIGAGFYGGSEYMLSNDIGLNLGFKLSFANLLLRNATGSNSDTEFQLRDAADPNLKFSGDKSFSFYTLFGGINFYWGITEKRYKYPK